jgi:pimeloyl-ACP methyl ester carboxylesterase
MQAHHLPVPIPFGEKSEAHWATKPTGKAVIFVHGFGGSAINTWVQFPSLLQTEGSCGGHDLIFYGYDGLRIRAHPSADLLGRFLEQLFTNPAEIVVQSLGTASRSPTFSYRQVVIVAHSLGAVVSRLALLDAYRKGRSWTSRTGLVLFAPAHTGAHIIPLASLAMGALRLAPVEALARFRFQVLNDLDENSQTLKDLADRTRKALRKGAKHLVAIRVVHAGDDKIVNYVDFCEDPPAEFIHGVSHTGVCKPRPDFREPLLQVLSSI